MSLVLQGIAYGHSCTYSWTLKPPLQSTRYPAAGLWPMSLVLLPNFLFAALLAAKVG